MTNVASNRPSRRKKTGFSLVEMLLALGLMGFLCLAIANFLVKGNAASASLNTRFQEASEVQYVIMDIMNDLAQGAYISPNSHKNRLEYTTYDSSGAATKKIYQITTISNIQYLQLSTDGGTTWGSPSRISAYTKYQLTGTPLFLYAQDANNCTSFTDTNANGVWQTGTDAAGVTSSCGPYTTASPVLTSPTQATKVVLSGWVFSSTTGNPLVARALPSNIFMACPQGVVISTASAVAGVKDAPMFNSFPVATANSLFGAAFDIRGLVWDSSHQILVMTGHHTSAGPTTIFRVERNGVIISPAQSMLTSYNFDSIALMGDNQNVMVLDASNKNVLSYNLTAKSPISWSRFMNLGSGNGSPGLTTGGAVVTTPYSIAYDPNTPTEYYVAGTSPSDGSYNIFEINYTTGALGTVSMGTSKVALPVAFDATHPPGGMFIEPTTGDFVIVRNYVNGTAPNQTIDIYRITRAGVSTSFSVNISDLGSTATTTTGYWGLAYNPETNHLFLSDAATQKVYEVIPSLLITPRS